MVPGVTGPVLWTADEGVVGALAEELLDVGVVKEDAVLSLC